MPAKLLITGSAGLVGQALTPALAALGFQVSGFDLRSLDAQRGDVCDLARVREAMEDVRGVVHLAAVSRVVWGEQDPLGCWRTNVVGLHNILTAASEASPPPWVLFASSREVYGIQSSTPVSEECRLDAINAYGRSKIAGEGLILAARQSGLRASTVRLSNVYGSLTDHADRVVPAFANAAVAGESLLVEGADHVFDFTHIDDVVQGILSLVEHLNAEAPALPPIHLVTGTPTTLGSLARLAIKLAGSNSDIIDAPARPFDIHWFVGDRSRAKSLLGWSPRVRLEDGLTRLVKSLQLVRGVPPCAPPPTRKS